LLSGTEPGYTAAVEVEMSEENDATAEEAEHKGGERMRPPNLLSKPSDIAERPGFRQPANARSKATKRKKRRKKR